MSDPPREPPQDPDRVLDAISEGAAVEWEAELAARPEDAEQIEALRLIHDVARAQRGEAPMPSTPPLPDRWGRLEVRGRVGEGAYGEVFRAFDPGLRREVALKLWAATGDPRVNEQILQEARELARVTHPNVLAVYGADVHEGRAGMWTELLEGATLEQMLAALGPCTWREAVMYGVEVCRALTAVHALGLVHRDVKAANVMRASAGRVVLMDFGSAIGPHSVAAGGMQGTPLAMAPEVLRGEPASPASDLFSVGAMLFRLVTGRYPIEADSLDQLRDRHGRGPLPSLREVRPDAPPAFAHAVDRALARDPRERPASAVDLERLLTESLVTEWGLALTPARDEQARRPASWTHRMLAWGAAAAAIALLGWVGWRALGLPWDGPGRPLQFTIKLPPGEHLGQYANAIVSPNGDMVAFASVDSLGRSALWVRRFDALESVRVPGTEGASYPFWSPDSRQVGFFTRRHLKRVGIEGDSARIVCDVELGRGGTWNRSGTIVFAGSSNGPLQRVQATGGASMPVTLLPPDGSETSHRWPFFLPDGERFLYVSAPERRGKFTLFVGSLRSERRVYVGEVESGAVYSSGLLVYLNNRTMEARPFDARTLRWKGDPVPIANLPSTGGSVAEPHASVSQDGMLVYTYVFSGGARLDWVDARTGYATVLSAGPYFYPSISPDGRRIAVELAEGAGRSSLWLIDAATGASERWLDSPGLERAPVWSARGDSILYASNRTGSAEFFVRATNGSVQDRRVPSITPSIMAWADEWRPDGAILFTRYEPVTGYNLYEWRGGRITPIARTDANEMHPATSPDGHWMAYDSDESGVKRVYLVDRRTSQRWAVSPAGGASPRWAALSGQLFYQEPNGTFVEMTPVPGVPPTEWRTRKLFRTGRLSGYAVDPLGRRLLCCIRVDSGRPAEIGVLANLSEAVEHGP